jgi:hypothetical protein
MGVEKEEVDNANGNPKMEKDTEVNVNPNSDTTKKTIERKLIMQRNLEEKKEKESEKKSKKSETSEKSKKSEDEKKGDNDEDKEKVISEDVINFVDTFKRNCIFLLRNTGVYQGFEAVLNGIKFNISKIDGFLEHAAEMFDMDVNVLKGEVNSDIKFGEGDIQWEVDELKTFIIGFYD